MYIWNHELYYDDTNELGWYKCIGDNTSDKAIGIKVEVRGWDIQLPKGLWYLIRELEFDK